MNQEAHTIDRTRKPDVLWAEDTARTYLDLEISKPVQKEAVVTATVSYSYVVELQIGKSIRRIEQDNKTSQEKQTVDLNMKAEKLFEFAIEEEFEDGVESSFSNKLQSFIKEHGNDGLLVLPPIFINEKVNAEIISEALRWIGRLEHPDTHYFRLWLLEKCLFCNSPSIRDGAILGLAAMNDPAAISYIKKAIEKEPISALQQDMKEIVSQLEPFTDAITTEEDQKK